VFVGGNDERLTALNSSNGQRLWEFPTRAGMNPPANVFEYEGEQHRGLRWRKSVYGRPARRQCISILSLKRTLTSGFQMPAQAPTAPPAEHR
jgi:hypothetical protein